jgi:hypothetical protein
MVLRADDELRHPTTDIPEWRESQWYCFDVPDQSLGVVLYYAYTPNTAQPSARLIAYVTRGWNRAPNTTLYSFDQDFAIPQDEWDDLNVGSIARFKRLEPLKRWALSFHDNKRLDLELEVDLFAGNWHWIDNVYETPRCLAGDRYHRPFAATGEMTLDGRRYALDVTGDSDHSWGPRQWGPLYKSKYVAGQCGRDWAMSFIEVVAADGSVRPYGFVWDGKRMSPISNVEIAADYDDDGIHRGVLMNIVDGERRLTRVQGTCFASAPTQTDTVSNNDCYFNFTVNGSQHAGSGILSFFWNRQYYQSVMRRVALPGADTGAVTNAGAAASPGAGAA